MELDYRDGEWVKTALEQRRKALDTLDKIAFQVKAADMCGNSNTVKLAAYEEIRKLVL